MSGDELEEAVEGGAIVLRRDCEATMVPFGDRVSLSEGGVVFVVQRLGGSVTVRTEMGTLMRIDSADADALGLDATLDDAVHRAGPFGMDQVTAALHTVFDPEIPVSIVDLGLVYRCDEVVRADGSRLIDIDLTMTAPGCGMGDVLRSDAERVVRSVPGVDAVDVHLVWDPPWGIDRMTDEVRLELGLL